MGVEVCSKLGKKHCHKQPTLGDSDQLRYHPYLYFPATLRILAVPQQINSSPSKPYSLQRRHCTPLLEPTTPSFGMWNRPLLQPQHWLTSSLFLLFTHLSTNPDLVSLLIDSAFVTVHHASAAPRQHNTWALASHTGACSPASSHWGLPWANLLGFLLPPGQSRQSKPVALLSRNPPSFTLDPLLADTPLHSNGVSEHWLSGATHW